MINTINLAEDSNCTFKVNSLVLNIKVRAWSHGITTFIGAPELSEEKEEKLLKALFGRALKKSIINTWYICGYIYQITSFNDGISFRLRYPNESSLFAHSL